MLGQLQALGLVIRADAPAIEGIRPREHLLVDQAADDLAVLDNEWHLVGTHLPPKGFDEGMPALSTTWIGLKPRWRTRESFASRRQPMTASRSDAIKTAASPRRSPHPISVPCRSL